MCGRFTLTRAEREEVAAELGIDVDDLPYGVYRPRWNIAPTDPHWIVRLKYEDREALPAKWGLVNTWARDAKRAAKQINARAETIATNSAYREAFGRRRCVVPADGFFEWRGDAKNRQPIWFHREDNGLILFAGLYESWQPEIGNWQRTFTIVTTDSNELIEPIHDRMPVILQGDDADRWMDPRETDLEALQKLLIPAPRDYLIGTPVSQKANSVKNDDPSVLEPAEVMQPLL